MFEKIKNWFKYNSSSQQNNLEDWFIVTWDKDFIYRSVTFPKQAEIQDKIQWSSIKRICFEANGIYSSDEIHIFTVEKTESYTIPTEAKGGLELWQFILTNNLFPNDLAMKAMGSTSGIFCFPELK